jgi:hypothetical protein
MSSKRYIQIANRFRSKNADIKPQELDMLEIFAQKPYLSINQIFSIIKSTPLEMAYKNVHTRVRKLKTTLGLIEEVKLEELRIRNNEKFYKLTEEGVYQLFLRRPNGIWVDLLSVKKGQEPRSNVRTFLQYYGNSDLFHSFLYPYFSKETIFTEDLSLLVTLLSYLHDCCKQVDIVTRIASSIPVKIPIFSWNKIPQQGLKELLMSLKEIFDLKEYDGNNIDDVVVNKTDGGNAISVTTSKVRVLIKLDHQRKKAIATLDNSDRKHEYDILKLGSDVDVYINKPDEESLDDRKLLEIPVYRLVTNLGKSSVNPIDHDTIRILCADDKFTGLIDEMLNTFRKGYDVLVNLRKSY